MPVWPLLKVVLLGLKFLKELLFLLFVISLVPLTKEKLVGASESSSAQCVGRAPPCLVDSCDPYFFLKSE